MPVTYKNIPAWDAAARTIGELTKNGYMAFVVPSAIGAVVGLANEDERTDKTEVLFGFYINANTFQVIEAGVTKTAALPFNATDVFKIEVLNGEVRYYRNDQFVYLSQSIVNRDAFPLFGKASLFHYLDSVDDVQIVEIKPPPFEAGITLYITARGVDSSATCGQATLYLSATGKSKAGVDRGRLPSFGSATLYLSVKGASGTDAPTFGHADLYVEADGYSPAHWIPDPIHEYTAGHVELAQIYAYGSSPGQSRVYIPIAARGISGGENYGAIDLQLVVVAYGKSLPLNFLSFTLPILPRFEMMEGPDLGTDDGLDVIDVLIWEDRVEESPNTPLFDGGRFKDSLKASLTVSQSKHEVLRWKDKSTTYELAPPLFSSLLVTDALGGGVETILRSRGIARIALAAEIAATTTGSDTARWRDSQSTYEDAPPLFSSLLVVDEVDADAVAGVRDRALVADAISAELVITTSSVERLVATDAAHLVVEADSADAALAHDALRGAVAITGSSLATAQALDAIQTDIGTEAASADALLAADSAAANLSISDSLVENAAGSDSVVISLHSSAASHDVIVANDELQSATHYALGDVEDRAFVTDAIAATLSSGASFNAVGYFKDGISSTGLMAQGLEDFTVAADVLQSQVHSSHGVWADIGLVADELAATVHYSAHTKSAWLFRDALEFEQHVEATTADRALIHDRVFEIGKRRLYVMNCATSAMSEYQFEIDVASIANSNQCLYVAGKDGLYALDAPSDDGMSIRWMVETGQSDFAVEALKRVREVNVLGHTQGRITLEVVANTSGHKHSRYYEMPALPRGSYRDGVIKTGNGIKSVFYGLKLHGSDAAAINSIKVHGEALSRKR